MREHKSGRRRRGERSPLRGEATIDACHITALERREARDPVRSSETDSGGRPPKTSVPRIEQPSR